MRLQRKKDAAESGRRGTRCYSESISPEDRERIALGASGSTGYSYHQRQSGNACEYVSGSWEMKKNQKTDDTAAIDSEARPLGFGEFEDWAYAEVIMQKQRYAQFTLGETEAQ